MPTSGTDGPGVDEVPSGRSDDPFSTRWAVTLRGPSNEDEIDGVAAGVDGSVWITGKYERATVLAGSALESAGRADIPLARLDRDGDPHRVQTFGGIGEDNFFDIDADDDGAVASGWFEGAVDFGGTLLTSAGSTDCAVVSFDNAGEVRWARSFGGPGADGCNEIVVGPDGAVTTSIDTQGGWSTPEGTVAPQARVDTVLLRLDRSGELAWSRSVGGAGRQRGKALAVGPDGSVVFGGDTVGDLEIDGSVRSVPGAGADAWLARWTADGTFAWAQVWGGPGDDLVKGLAADGSSVFAVGTFVGAVEISGVELDAGDTADLALTRFDVDGSLGWATSVSAGEALTGAEIAGAADGGVLFGSWVAPGTVLHEASGSAEPLDTRNGGTAWLAHYRPDGSVAFAATIEGTAGGGPDELDRTGTRVYLDLVVRGSANAAAGVVIEADGKDGSLWALDLAGQDSTADPAG